MDIEFTAAIWFWKGPAPHHFVTVPVDRAPALAAASQAVTYGWGMIPVAVRINRTRWKTSLFPRDGSYIVPLKAAVRRAEHLSVDDTVTITLTVDV